MEPDPFLVSYEEQTLDSREGQAAGPALFSAHLSWCTDHQDHLKKEFKNILIPHETKQVSWDTNLVTCSLQIPDLTKELSRTNKPAPAFYAAWPMGVLKLSSCLRH